jgi:hypothetical protein
MNFKSLKFLTKRRIEAGIFLVIFFGVFYFISNKMGLPNMLNTIMQTSYSLLIDTVLYIMGITVLSGALGKLLTEFGVVRLLEVLLKPLMKPLYNLPGVAALGAVLTFLSDNPAIISLAKDNNFSKYFKKYQLISLTNFGTAFGMGLVVIIFMAGKGYAGAAIIGLVGAVIGSIISTRLMQRFTIKDFPEFKTEFVEGGDEQKISFKSEGNMFLRVLNAILDGGKTGVDLGLAIIPGVLIISTFVMILTFGASPEGYTGKAYEGIALLPYLAGKVVVFDAKFKKMEMQNGDVDRNDLHQIHSYSGYYRNNLIASGLIYPLSKEINTEKAYSKSIYGNDENEINFIVDGIFVSESQSMKELIKKEDAFVNRIASVINRN